MQVQHWFQDLKTMIGGVGGTAPCLIHGHGCSTSVKVDILAAGFPCAPFSGQRPDRHGTRRWVQIQVFILETRRAFPPLGLDRAM
eukprot:3859163-Amphidinium_carterae.2